MPYKKGDVISFRWRGSGQTKTSVEVGVITEVLYVAGVNQDTGRGRGFQDRLGIRFLHPHPHPSPGWIYVHQVCMKGEVDG